MQRLDRRANVLAGKTLRTPALLRGPNALLDNPTPMR